jgi:hypothetical protein
VKIKNLFFLFFFGSANPKKIHFAVFAFVFLLFILFLFPSVIFLHKLEYKNYVIHSTEKIDPSITLVLDKSSTLLHSSELDDPTLVHDIYFFESFLYARFWGLYVFRAFGWNRFNGIYIVKTDIKKDLSFRNDVTYNTTILSEVIAHEVVHTLQRVNQGYIKMYQLPTWKVEGYAEYIRKDKKFNLSDSKKLLQEISPDHSYAADYIRYHICTQYLFSTKKVNSFIDLLALDLSMEKVLAEVSK